MTRRAFPWLVLALIVTGCSPAQIQGGEEPVSPALPAPEPARQRHVVAGDLYYGHPNVVYLHPRGCTGTVIGPRTVLTAAHCDTPQKIGIGTANPNLRWYAVKEMIRHPTYVKTKERDYDVAVVHLHSPVSVAPAKLASTRPVSGEFLELIGFGTTAYYAGDSGTKRRGTNNVGVVNTNTFIFKHLPSDLAASSCHGDSGGPTFNSQGLQIGVHFGKNTPDTDIAKSCTHYRAVAVRVDRFRLWITENMASKVSVPAPTSAPACGGVKATGCCDGMTLKYCDSGAIKTQSCAGSCGWSGKWYACGGSGPDPAGLLALQCPGSTSGGGETPPPPPPPPTDNCNGVTSAGCCSGGTLRFCSQGQLKDVYCSGTCGWNPAKGYYDCGGVGADPSGHAPLACAGTAGTSPPPPPPPPPPSSGSGCGAISFEGCCNGSTLLFCEAGALKTLSCNTCGWGGSLYDCGHTGADPSGKHPLACP